MISLFFLIFLLSCSYTPCCNHIKVIQVIDGDTVKLSDGRLLRYIGIDTPEVRVREKSRFVYNPQPFSLEAKELNRKLVENKFVRVEFDIEKFDVYGRMLGYCFVDDIFVNARLIEEGLAVLYTKPPNVKYTDLFVTLQKKAQALHKGIWGAYEVVSSNGAYNFINQIRTVKGKVKGVYTSKKAVFLNFGEDYRKDFTVVIFNDCLGFFKEKNINPLTFYRDKEIKVWGRIREYNGPEIIVCNPSQIEVVNEK